MTIQSIELEYNNKTYQVILEDGVVSFIDPDSPWERITKGQASEVKITSHQAVVDIGLKMIERHCAELEAEHYEE